MQQKRNTCLAFPGRVSRAFSLLLLLLLCGTASAELVYTVVSKDYSIGRVNYDAGGLPQNETVLKDIKASGLYFNEVFSTDQGEWRVLTQTTSRDATDTHSYYDSYSYSYSLYDPDGDWKTPLAKAENLRGSIYYQDDSSLYLVSEDYPSYTVSKVDKKTLAVTRGAETLKGWPDFGYLKSDGIIYSRYDGEKQSLTVLDKDLKGKTFALDDGNYSVYDYYNGRSISLGDGSLVMTFVSQDVQGTTTDLGIFKFTPSEKTQIVTSVDVGFSASDTQGSIGNLTSDKSGGLYFVVNKYGTAGSSTLYHWDGSRTTSVFKAAEGESIGTYALDGSGNIYCSVSKHVRNESTQTSTVTTSLYRVGTSAPVYKETYTGTTGTNADLSINEIENDNSGNVYFRVRKSTSGWSHGDGPTSVKSQSYALYRCGASATTATKLHEETDGSRIDYFWISSSSSSSSVEDGSRFYDDSGNVYFKVSSEDRSASHTYTSDVLYRCGASATSATRLHEEKTDGYMIKCAGMDGSDNLYFGVCSQDVGRYSDERRYIALYCCGPSQITPDTVKKVTDGSIIVDDIPKESSKGVYFAVAGRRGVVTAAGEEIVGPVSSYGSYAFCHYDGTDVTTIHTFNNVSEPGRGVDEKHKVLYLYARYASPLSPDLGSTLLAFDNTDRHNPEKLEEFNVAGTIGNVKLYNHTVSSVIPAEPTRSNTTPKSDVDLSKTPASGLTSFPFTVWSTDGTMVPGGTVFKIWITILSHLSVAANLADAEEQYYCEGLKSDEDGKLVINPSKMKLLDAKGNEVSEFPGGTCRISYESADGKHYGKYPDSVTLAKSSSSSSGGATSNKGSGGCDAGFGALALAVLAAGVLLKKHSK